MKYVPKSFSRFGHRSLLKLNASSPTILVVGGVVGLGATAVLAARASRDLDPIVESHKKRRATLDHISYVNNRARQEALLRLYAGTATDLTKLYGPTIIVGTLSATAVLAGHKILNRRHLATMAAYSGLAEQFQAYRGRVAKTLGKDMEQAIFEGAHGEYEEDPDHKGEYKLKAKWDESKPASYLTPWFDESNVHWTPDPETNFLTLKGTQQYMNNLLQIRGHVTLNDVFDQLKMARVPEGQIAGWLYDTAAGDGYIDFGIFTGMDPNTIAFREHRTPRVQLNFNIDKGTIWEQVGKKRN